MRGSDLANHTAEIEPQLRIKFAGELLHTLVVGETRHMQERNAAVAGSEQCARKQRRANTVALPRLLNAEGRFRLARDRHSDRAQLSGAAHCAVHEESMDNGIDAGGQCRIFGQEFVRYVTAKAIAPTGRIEPKQVLTIATSFDRPHLANDATFGKQLVHHTPWHTRSPRRDNAISTFASRPRYDIYRGQSMTVTLVLNSSLNLTVDYCGS